MKMRRLLILGMAALLTVVSCTNDPDWSSDVVGGGNAPDNTFTRLEADQSRVIFRDVMNAYAATRAVTRADADHPWQASPAVADLKARGVAEYDANQLYNGGDWIITDATSANEIWISTNNKANIYVAKSNMKIWLSENGNTMIGTVYVLDTDANGNPVENVQFPTYWPEGAMSIPNGWEVKFWNKPEINKLALARNCAFYYYGADELVIPEILTTAPNSGEKSRFECHGPVKFTGKVDVIQGSYWFGNKVYFADFVKQQNGHDADFVFEDEVEFEKASIENGLFRFNEKAEFNNLHIYNDPVKLIFEKCGYISDLTCQTDGKFTIDANYFLKLDGFVSENGANWDINLNDALLVVSGDKCTQNSDHGDNVFVQNIVVTGKGHSAVVLESPVSIDKGKEDRSKIENFRTVNPYDAESNPDGDMLAILGPKVDGVYVEPTIYVYMAEGDLANGTITQESFANAGVCYLPSGYVIHSRDANDCCAEYANNTAGGPTIIPPKHKYSATSIDWYVGSDNETYIYVCWHSNIKGAGETQTDADGNQFQHDHGTNVKPGADDAGPSVEDEDDWGGIVEIIRCSGYNPEDPATYNLTVKAPIENSEHKYNHVKYHDGSLYLATTSWLVGAAMHVVPLNAACTDFADGGRRVNLTGVSANCVEIVGNNALTVSGRKEGGLNWFALDDESNQEKKYVNREPTAYYGGKYVCTDGDKVYVLHNTDNAEVTVYDAATKAELTSFSTDTPLVPYDGKNVMMVKNGKIYICCGRSGLLVCDTSGNKVGRCAKFSANGIDVDSNGYMYVATGAGLLVLDPDSTNEDGDYRSVAYEQYTGEGFVYPHGWEEDLRMPAGTAKESSNFVKLSPSEDAAFVAYGMYGLRIYPVSQLLNK